MLYSLNMVVSTSKAKPSCEMPEFQKRNLTHGKEVHNEIHVLINKYTHYTYMYCVLYVSTCIKPYREITHSLWLR